MSINWVMTGGNEGGFIKLPNERILHTSPSRTSLQISTPNTFPGAQPFSIKSDSGVVYITNQRIVYLPTNPAPELESFSAPILNLQDTCVRAPFFGANYWTALCKPVAGGGIPATHPAVELRLTFREGGAFDYHTIYEQIKERLYHAYTLARESGQRGTVDVDLEQLPAYEPAQEVEEEDTAPAILSPIPVRPQRNGSIANTAVDVPPSNTVPAPDEPPPGYEETQANAVGVDLEQRLREEARRL